jgi:hypothetical protein
MKTMPRLIGTALLGLTLVSTSEAKPRQTPKAPQAASTLTLDETYCQTLGALAFKQAQARDAGLSYLTVLEILRRLPTPPTAAGAQARQAGITLLRVVYDFPHTTPVTFRRNTELTCLDQLAPTLTDVQTSAQ